MKKAIDYSKIMRITVLVLLDIVLINLASFLALWVRYEFHISDLDPIFRASFFEYSVAYSFIAILLFIPLKLYNSLWEFAGMKELFHIVLAAALLCVLQFLARMIFPALRDLPRSYPILNMLFLILLISCSRFSYRAIRSLLNRGSSSSKVQRRTMIIGAGNAGLMALREFSDSVKSKNKVVCIIDDDKTKQGQYIFGVLIVGDRFDIPKMAEHYHVEEIVLAIPSLSVKEKKEILGLCQNTHANLKILPGLYQLANGEVSTNSIRDVDVLDLLGRDSISVDLSEISAYIGGKTVFVTGGGGSIGSELCRQIAKYHPKQLVIIDIYENNAYEIQQELKRHDPSLNLQVRIASIRDTARIDRLFAEFRPEIVFHAAAHKHVPLMEDSPNEAVKNNVFGTLNVARAADKYGVNTFVQISTDKAVNPTNVMGATKRICEMIIQSMANKSRTKFVAVRFGNVLGSNGSVIPLFKRQIAEGGPVTVTDPNIIRFFMTIPEAVSLVLQAGYYANRGEIFVLDMGDPVRIDDLARNMIRLSGFEPDVDIPIMYTGLRPGEKMYEEILMDEEGLRSTPNQLIHIGKPIEINEEEFSEDLDRLYTACCENSNEIRTIISDIVPTYHIPEPAAAGN
ncbi:MAG: polysaccharide biosynthesis protein [Clostridia bacterium]|nr:polysaccharide biosynthesis protein [Clostridia bacterium]